jgi:colanic acid/amylovoran biosynthesis glycosyltransferase
MNSPSVGRPKTGARAFARGASDSPRIAYIMSRFPKITETFILYEIIALKRRGYDVRIYPLLRERAPVVHPDAEPLVAEARYLPFLSWPILRSHIQIMAHSPVAYFGALGAILAGTFGSRRFFAGAIAFFPKTVHAARLMKDEGIEHVHCHFASHPAAAGFVIHRLTGIRFSFTAHGSDLHVDRHMLCAKLSEASFVVGISEDNRQLIGSECGEQALDKTIVLHCGVDTDVFQPRRERSSGGRLRVICVGTLHEVKGQTFLIEACRRLALAGIELECQLVGTGPDRSNLERQIEEAGLRDRITLLGARTREEIASLLNAADVLVAPSVPTARGSREGIPVVLMEAMSTALPVVASRLSGIPELVEDGRTGILVQPGDPGGIAKALERLAHDPALGLALGRAGRETVLRDFNVAVNAARLGTLFEASRAA